MNKERKEGVKRLPKWAVYALFVFICVAFLFILRSIRPPNLRTTYSLIFQDIYKSAPTTEISSFDEGEQWKGTYTLDSERTIDGETGMNMFSMNGVPTKVTLAKTFDLTPYDTVYSYLYIDKQDTLKNTKSFVLTFTDTKGTETSYEITSLKAGWNLIRMPMADFKPKGVDAAHIATTAVTLVSKKDQNAQISLDRIWAQGPLRTSDFSAVNLSSVNLKTISKKTFLHISSAEPTSLVFAKSVSSSRFSYTTGLSPLKFGTYGLSILTDPRTENGYFFMISGKAMNQWHLLKKENGRETELQQGTLPQNTFEKGAMIWLRTEKNGSMLSFSFAVNGQQYASITSYKDTTFTKGNIGVVAAGSYVLDSVDLKE